MIWHAPPWSLASAQLTHGWPRKLTSQSHGGFLPGNITVCAKATNLTLRRLAVCDVACLVSKQTTEGAGLSRARLLNLRYAALSYHRGSFCPQYLASAMVEYGVNFATFEALSSHALDALHASLTQGWREGPLESSDSEEASTEEPLIACSSFPAPVMVEIGKGAEAEGQESSRAEDQAALCTLLARFSCDQPESDSSSGSELESASGVGLQRGPTAGRGPRAANANAGRKRRKTASVGGPSSSKSRRTAEPESTTSAGNAKTDKKKKTKQNETRTLPLTS